MQSLVFITITVALSNNNVIISAVATVCTLTKICALKIVGLASAFVVHTLRLLAAACYVLKCFLWGNHTIVPLNC